MKEYTKEEAVEQMDRWGQERQPFLFMIDYQQERMYADTPDRLSPSEILYDLNGYTNAKAFVEKQTVSRGKEMEEATKRAFEWHAFPMSLEEYAVAFEKVKRHIYAGNSYLVNLTCSTPVKTDLTQQEIFYRAAAK